MRIGVKICGLTTAEQVRAAIDAGADAVGFVLAASPRRVTPATARELAALVPPGVLRVAVFGPEDDAAPDGLGGAFDLLQVEARHVAGFAATGVPVVPVLRGASDAGYPSDAGDPSDARYPSDAAYPAASIPGSRVAPPTVVFDGPRSGRGERADWTGAASIARRTRLMLAGGLDAVNVSRAIEGVRPAWVDVSSGVESAPARKDPARIAAFVAAVRATENG